MSIRKEAKRASRKSTKGKYPEGYVIPETAIREFVEKLGIHDIEDAAVRMQAVADATNRLLEAPKQQVDPADLRIILRIAAQSKNRR